MSCSIVLPVTCRELDASKGSLLADPDVVALIDRGRGGYLRREQVVKSLVFASLNPFSASRTTLQNALEAELQQQGMAAWRGLGIERVLGVVGAGIAAMSSCELTKKERRQAEAALRSFGTVFIRNYRRRAGLASTTNERIVMLYEAVDSLERLSAPQRDELVGRAAHVLRIELAPMVKGTKRVDVRRLKNRMRPRREQYTARQAATPPNGSSDYEGLVSRKKARDFARAKQAGMANRSSDVRGNRHPQCSHTSVRGSSGS